ncbi:MAG: hypothetical protein HYX20_01590 [Candidatus Yanofskybacteria bacterium]|nr:hypothetical protein [Candidatus Yanofskybacteria bacterium]
MNSRKDYQVALASRLEGKTYGEIRGLFGIPKSTLSNWFSTLELNSGARRILESKRKNGYLKLLEFNKIRTLNIKKENEDIRKNYESRIGTLNNRELMILGAGLYWGEGYKNFNPKRFTYPYMCFGNSDPEMILVFVSFLNKVMGISKDRIRGQVMIYPNLDSNKCIKYWQNLTKVPKENFRCQVALSRASRGKRPMNLLPHGTLQLRVSQRQEFFKIRGLMDGIIRAAKL